MRQNLQEYFRVLELNPGAGPLEIRRAYRHMVQRWHPDHFKPGSPMQATAEDITKELNNAFEQLYRKKLYRKFLPKSDYSAGDATPPDLATKAPFPGDTASPIPPDQAPPKPRRRPVIRAWFARKREQLRSGKLFRKPKHFPWARATALAGLAVLLVPVWQKTHEPQAVERAMQVEAGRLAEAPDLAATAAAGTPAREARAVEDGAAAKDEEAPHAYPALPELKAQEPAEMTISFRRSASETHLRRAEAALDVFEVGDPKSKVLALQGTPDEETEHLLRYGASVVYLRDGVVTGWSDQLPRLRIRKWTTIESALNTFTVGSTMADVIRAQGLPTMFTENTYTYGSSVISFENDRVVGWTELDVPLRAFDLPASPFVDLDQLRAPSLSALGDIQFRALSSVSY
jgi:hypothetical protein